MTPTISPALPVQETDSISLSAKPCRRQEQPSQDISFVNAHGTATVYNDEMESKALTLAHLEQVPVT